MKIQPLEGKTALVTGASRGLGKAIALALAEAGAELVLASRDVTLLEQTAQQARALGVKAFAFRTDVTREADILDLQKEISQCVGNLQILVNNAGMNIRKAATDFTLEEWRRVLDTNLTSAFLMCRTFVPMMKGKGYGRILNLTSIMSHIALPG